MPVPTAQDFGVRFGRTPDRGTERQKAFPFMYSFINHNDDTWEPVSTVLTAPSLANLGPTVSANSKITHNVMLDPDYNFKLLFIRYSVYNMQTIEDVPICTWYENTPATGVNDGVDPSMMLLGTPLYHYIKMSVSCTGSGAQYLYGGHNTQSIFNGQSLIPVPVEVMQGYDYGVLSVRTPRLLPLQGALVFEITNTHTRLDLVVAAMIYGMKVRV